MKTSIFILLSVMALAQSARAQQDSAPAQAGELPPAKTENGVTYVCGGIGQAEAEQMKRAASGYDMMLTFAERNGSYLADVDVDIASGKGKGASLLSAHCDGPIMLIDLPKAGTYHIQAEAEGRTVALTTRVRHKKPVQMVSLTWPEAARDDGLR